MTLAVVGRHYDEAAVVLLGLSDGEWQTLADLSRAPDSRLFVGVTNYDLAHGIVPRTWQVKRVAVQPFENGFDFKLDAAPDVVLDTGVPITEQLYSLDTAFSRITSTDGWQDVLPAQLGRR